MKLLCHKITVEGSTIVDQAVLKLLKWKQVAHFLPFTVCYMLESCKPLEEFAQQILHHYHQIVVKFYRI